jgi:hypothetical protein
MAFRCRILVHETKEDPVPANQEVIAYTADGSYALGRMIGGTFHLSHSSHEWEPTSIRGWMEVPSFFGVSIEDEDELLDMLL